MSKLDLEKSKFQLLGQRITKVEFIAEKNVVIEQDAKPKMEAEIEVAQNEKEPKAFVTLKLKIELEKQYKINLEIIGHFQWQGEEIEKNLKVYLSVNAPAVLISYVRTTVSQLTLNAGFSAFILPLINFANNKEVKE